MQQSSPRQSNLLICLFLVAVTALIYAKTSRYEFVSYDDSAYVLENPHVRMGWTLEGIKWAFTNTCYYHWFPLTWLTHMFINQVWGLNPAPHHALNVLLHMVNAVLCFVIWMRLTGQRWQSAFVAAVFCVHPINVESVAWVSERSNVLSAMFWFLCMGSYVQYVRRPSFLRYGLVAFLLALGLMAKPALMTLPFVFLLLDYWPLGRLTRESFSKLVAEKIPLFFLAACSVTLTLYSSWRIHVLVTLENLSVGNRIGNALIAYVLYLGKMIWPIHCAFFYPHLGDAVALVKVLSAGALIAAISIGAFMARKVAPYFWMGWLWYLGTIFPVSGLIAAGPHSIADRYAYISFLGLFVALTWAAADLVARVHFPKVLLAALAGSILSALMILASVQAETWRNSVSLYRHATRVTQENYLAHYNLAEALSQRGESREALEHYREAAEIMAGQPDYRLMYGIALRKQGHYSEAIAQFEQILSDQPNHDQANYHMAVTLCLQGNSSEAAKKFALALGEEPGSAQVHYCLAGCMAQVGKWDEARFQYQEAIRCNPSIADLRMDYGIALSRQGKFPAAVLEFEQALNLAPNSAKVYCAMGIALALQGHTGAAADCFSKALALEPDKEETHYNLAVALFKTGHRGQARDHFLEALRLRPEYTEAREGLQYMEESERPGKK